MPYPRLPSFVLSMQGFSNCLKSLWRSHRKRIWQATEKDFVYPLGNQPGGNHPKQVLQSLSTIPHDCSIDHKSLNMHSNFVWVRAGFMVSKTTETGQHDQYCSISMWKQHPKYWKTNTAMYGPYQCILIISVHAFDTGTVPLPYHFNGKMIQDLVQVFKSLWNLVRANKTKSNGWERFTTQVRHHTNGCT